MNIIKTTIAAALAVASIAANAKTHAALVTITGNDRAIVAVQNLGPAGLVAAEFFAGTPQRGRVIFNQYGTDGDLAFAYVDHYAVTTIGLDLQSGEGQAFNFNLDQTSHGDIAFLPAVTNIGAYSAMRVNLIWADGFEAYIPMSRDLSDGIFTFTDIPVTPAIPEPGTAALMLAGIAAVAARKLAK